MLYMGGVGFGSSCFLDVSYGMWPIMAKVGQDVVKWFEVV